MNLNPLRWFFPRKDEEVEIEVEEPMPPTPVAVERRINGHDERAAAVEKVLAKTMEELQEDDFDERVQTITLGPISLSKEQIQNIMRNCGAKGKHV